MSNLSGVGGGVSGNSNVRPSGNGGSRMVAQGNGGAGRSSGVTTNEQLIAENKKLFDMNRRLEAGLVEIQAKLEFRADAERAMILGLKKAMDLVESAKAKKDAEIEVLTEHVEGLMEAVEAHERGRKALKANKVKAVCEKDAEIKRLKSQVRTTLMRARNALREGNTAAIREKDAEIERLQSQVKTLMRANGELRKSKNAAIRAKDTVSVGSYVKILLLILMAFAVGRLTA